MGDMEPFPHYYAAAGTAAAVGEIALDSAGLTTIRSAAPMAFGGPGDRWSPETLLVAAVADCYILTFRAIAGASHLTWTSLTCAATGTLDRVDRVIQFTAFTLQVHLRLPAGADTELAEKLLAKTEAGCLVAQSLKATPVVQATVEVAQVQA